jgi:hypothetical protein
MRVMSYNVLNGGRDGSSDKRWRTTVEVVGDARTATASDHLPVMVDLDPAGAR